MISMLQHQPKSVVLEKGYINVYTNLNPKERRQLLYKRRYKEEVPTWDDTLVYLSAKLPTFCTGDAVVLDAGCGNGNYVIDENRKNIAWAVGVDVSGEHIKKNICLDEIEVCTLENLPFSANTFDVVISLWVLEHLSDPEKVFKEIARVLKPSGVFMFATPNIGYLPLKLVHAVRSSKLNGFLNKTLFGREENAIFPTYYRANTLQQLRKLSTKYFDINELRLNADVSYTAFNELSYRSSKLMLKLPNTLSVFTHPHIVGILRK